MKKFYAESPVLTVKLFDQADVLTISYGDDNVGSWGGWFENGGSSNA
jgi:hypothetical protein